MKSDTRGRWIGLGQGEIVWVFEPTHPFESPSKVMRRWGLLFGPEFNGPSLILKVGSFYGFPARRGKEDERLPMCSLLLLSSSSTLAVATAFWFSTPFHFCSTKHTLPILPFIHQFSSKLAQSPTSFPNLGFIVRKDLPASQFSSSLFSLSLCFVGFFVSLPSTAAQFVPPFTHHRAAHTNLRPFQIRIRFNQIFSTMVISEAVDEMMAESVDSFGGTSRGPRLFIKEMVLCNFKSYAGEQRVGPFHKVAHPLQI